jgi:hypothetical protein
VKTGIARILTCILTALISPTALASKSHSRGTGWHTSIEALYGAITYHFIDDGGAAVYKQKLDRNGRLIFNQTEGGRLLRENKDHYYGITGFAGKNSVGLSMRGGLVSYGAKTLYEHLYVGWAIGGYTQNDRDFQTAGATPFHLFTLAHGNGFVPLIGIEWGLRLNFSNSVYLKIYNLITPVVTTAAICFGVSF